MSFKSPSGPEFPADRSRTWLYLSEWPLGLEFRSLALGGGEKGRHHLEAKCGIAPQRFKIGCGLGSSQCDFRHKSVLQCLHVRSGVDGVYVHHRLVGPQDTELRAYRTRQVWSLLDLTADQHRPCPVDPFLAELIVICKLQNICWIRV